MNLASTAAAAATTTTTTTITKKSISLNYNKIKYIILVMMVGPFFQPAIKCRQDVWTTEIRNSRCHSCFAVTLPS
jgi:hypothetical protein